MSKTIRFYVFLRGFHGPVFWKAFSSLSYARKFCFSHLDYTDLCDAFIVKRVFEFGSDPVDVKRYPVYDPSHGPNPGHVYVQMEG